MSSRATLDASVAIAWLLDQERPDWVDLYFDGLRAGRTRLLAPSLLWLEVGNRLTRATAVGDEAALEAMLHFEALGLEEVAVAQSLRLRALVLAREHGLTMYDAAYLAVAEAARAPLLTLDHRLEQAAASMGLGRDGDSRRVSDRTAGFVHRAVDLTSLAAIGAAIARMRRRDAEKAQSGPRARGLHEPSADEQRHATGGRSAKRSAAGEA